MGLTPEHLPTIMTITMARGAVRLSRERVIVKNMMLRTSAIEHARTRPLGVSVAPHPGAVATPLSRPFVGQTSAGRPFTPQIAAGHVLRVLDGLGPEANGAPLSRVLLAKVSSNPPAWSTPATGSSSPRRSSRRTRPDATT